MNGFTPKNLTFDEYRDIAEDCDLGLWKPTSFYGRIISRATDGPYSHINGVLWWGMEPWQVAYEEGRGGFAAPLRRESISFPGVIDIYRVTVPFDRDAVSARMKKLGHDYNWSYIKTIALLNAPLLRWSNWSTNAVRKAARGSAGGICSSHIAFSFAEDDVFFQDGKALQEINPNDIYRSPLTHYVCTLYPSEVKP